MHNRHYIWRTIVRRELARTRANSRESARTPPAFANGSPTFLFRELRQRSPAFAERSANIWRTPREFARVRANPRGVRRELANSSPKNVSSSDGFHIYGERPPDRERSFAANEFARSSPRTGSPVGELESHIIERSFAANLSPPFANDRSRWRTMANDGGLGLILTLTLIVDRERVGLGLGLELTLSLTVRRE